jgi:hypothetical protein
LRTKIAISRTNRFGEGTSNSVTIAHYNTTADAHPMHIHEVHFQIVNREGLVLNDEDEVVVPIQLNGTTTRPQPWENGWKDTVIAYPGQVTRVRLQFNNPGQFVWHCHIVEHEDNEMMRPYRIGPVQPGQPPASERRSVALETLGPLAAESEEARSRTLALLTPMIFGRGRRAALRPRSRWHASRRTAPRSPTT